MNRKLSQRIALAILLTSLAACVSARTGERPQAVGRTGAEAGRIIGTACPKVLEPETLRWVASSIEKDPSPEALAAGNDIDTQDRQSAACRGNR